jgi:hypothetical protein
MDAPDMLYILMIFPEGIYIKEYVLKREFRIQGPVAQTTQAKSQNPGIHFQTNQNLSISGMKVFFTCS